MKKLLLIVLFVSAHVFADITTQEEVDLLANLSARSKAITSLHGHFVQQKKIAVLPVPLNSTGQFQFDQGQLVIWEVLSPVHNIVRLTPKGISFENEQYKSQAAPLQAGVDVVAKIFMGVISGELSSLDGYFLIQGTGDIKHWQLVLSPRSPNLAAYIQNITIKGAELTEQLDIAETNGDTTTIRFTTDKVVRKAN